MNKPLLAAAVVSAATFGLHVIGGGAEIHAPIQDSDLPLPLRAVSAVLWHFVSAVLLLQAVAFVWLSRQPSPPLVWFLIALQACIAGPFLFYGITMLGTVWTLGQWLIFVVIAALGLWGARAAAE